MIKKVLISLLIVLFYGCFSPKGLPIKKVTKMSFDKSVEIENRIDHSAWDMLLKTHVRSNGMVDYKGFKKDVKALNDYVQFLSTQIPAENWSVQEQLAYFINCYNANTVKLIVDHYPVKSIKDIDATISPFLKTFIKIGDEEFSLASLEKGILQQMDEPRIHFAINCASYSCPKLMRDAYTAKNVNELMDLAAKTFVNSDKNQISRNHVALSEIFKWYKNDFLRNSASIIDYVNHYSETQISPDAEISYIEYNWDLNEID